MTITKEKINELLKKYHLRACARYSENRVIATYFNKELQQVVNIVVPTEEMLCLFSKRILNGDVSKDKTITVKDTDSRYFTQKELIYIRDNEQCIFNEDYTKAMELMTFPTIILRAAAGKPVYDKDIENMAQAFMHSVAKKELIVLKYIINKIGTEGTLLMTETLKELGISRPVVTSLLSKLKEYNIAEIKIQGVKGTHIKFTNQRIFNEI